MGATLWWFVADPNRVMRRAAAQMQDVADSRLPAPYPEQEELLAVHVLLTVDRRWVVVCHDLCPVRYRLTEAGYVDADHQWEAVRLCAQLMDLTPPDAISFGREVALREIQRRHIWRLTDEQAQAVANAVNAAATRPPMVVVTRAGLSPAR